MGKRTLALAAIAIMGVSFCVSAPKATVFTQTFPLHHHKVGPPWDLSWLVVDAAFKVYNPAPVTNAIRSTLTAVDNPNFEFSDGSRGTYVFDDIIAAPYADLISNGGFLAGNMFTGAISPPAEWQPEWTQYFSLTVESLSGQPFYLYGPADGFIAAGTGSTPQVAFHTAWKYFSDYVPVEWDSDIQRWVIPYTNFYHNDTEWPEGWQTIVEVQNSSGGLRSFTLFTQSYPYWGGPHGHPGSPPAVCMAEEYTPCGLCDKVHHFRTLCEDFNVSSGGTILQDAFRFHIDHDGARSGTDGGAALQISSGNPSGIEVRARISPNSSGYSCTLCN
ncbi:MAG: hypothetical protein ACE15E_24005 [Acidobacteriota bacterium]